MAHNTDILGVRIALGASYTPDTSIGLYTSELRWAEAPLAGVAQPWATGILVKDGIGDVSESADLRRGGAPAQLAGLTITIQNATQIFQRLDALGIALPGLSLELVEFVGTEADADSVSITTIFLGVIDDISWNVRDVRISAKNSRDQRRANLAYKITETDFPHASASNIGKVIPITFGQHYPLSDSSGEITRATLAKYVRTDDAQDDGGYDNRYFTGGNLNPPYTYFPIVATGEDGGLETYDFEDYGTDIALWPTVYPTDTYMFVTDGIGAGKLRKVASFSKPDTNLIRVTLADWMDEALGTSGANRSWVKFEKIYRQYNADVWPCKALLDGRGDPTEGKVELYVKNSDGNKALRVGDYGYTAKPDADNNAVTIDPKFYVNNIDDVSGFVFAPVTALERMSTTDLSAWNTAEEPSWGSFTKGNADNTNGVYASNVLDAVTSVTETGTGNQADRDSSTYYRFKFNAFNAGGACVYKKVLTFSLPPLPASIGYNDSLEIYIGLKMSTGCSAFYAVGTDDSSFRIMLRRFKYKVDKVLSTLKLDEGTTALVDDVPDFYYVDSPDTANKNFYVQSSAQGDGSYSSITGYQRFVLTNVDTREKYESYVEGALVLGRRLGSSSSTVDDTYVYEMCVFVKKSGSIKSDIFVPLSGRIVNDPFNWGGRRPSDTLLTNPIDILEHVKRLQSGVETGSTAKPGIEYWPDAPIKTSGEGSYDDSSLAPEGEFADLTTWKPKDLWLARQIDSYEDAWTDALTRSLCETAFLLAYYDTQGNECVKYLHALESPSETITYADLLEKPGDIKEPDAADVFCEPTLRFAYSQCLGDFQREFRVSNVQASTYDPSYTSGFEQAEDAEAIWNKYHALYLRFRQINPAPSNITDNKWLMWYGDAVWYLHKLADWMGKRRIESLVVPWSKGRLYSVGKHFKLNLPHQTDGYDVECMIESVKKNKQKNRVIIKAVLLE